MNKYVVRKIFTYSEVVEVEAESRSEAKENAMELDGEPCNDDSLYDCVIVREVISGD